MTSREMGHGRDSDDWSVGGASRRGHRLFGRYDGCVAMEVGALERPAGLGDNQSMIPPPIRIEHRREGDSRREPGVLGPQIAARAKRYSHDASGSRTLLLGARLIQDQKISSSSLSPE